MSDDRTVLRRVLVQVASLVLLGLALVGVIVLAGVVRSVLG